MIVLDCGTHAVTALTFGPDGGLIVGNHLGRVLRSDGFSLESSHSDEQTTPITALLVDPNSSTVYTSSDQGVQVLERKGLFTPLKTVVSDRHVTCMQILNNDRVAVGMGHANRELAGRITLYWYPQWLPTAAPTTEATGVRALTAHVPMRTMAWSTGGKQVVVWTITKPDKWRVSLPAAAPSIAFHPEGRWLAAAQDWNVLPIDTERKQLRDVMKGHKGRVTAVAFHPFDGTLYSASWDGTVRLWDVMSGTERRAFDWKLGRLTCLALAPDGTRAAAGSESGKVVIWDVG